MTVDEVGGGSAKMKDRAARGWVERRRGGASGMTESAAATTERQHKIS